MQIYSDSNLFSDAQYKAEWEFLLDIPQIQMVFGGMFSGIPNEIIFDCGGEFRFGICLDLLDLIPEKFRNSRILQDYVDECEVSFSNCLTQARNLINLVNPNTTTDVKYLRYLGQLIGADLPPEDTTDEVELRKDIEEAIYWYKLKGTYYSLKILAMISGLHIELYDMWTDDYDKFILLPWWSGNPNANPLGSTFYKSPHFAVEVLLDKIYQKNSINWLWYESLGSNIIERIEKTRPVHTVPHFLIRPNIIADIYGNVIETEGEIKGRTFGDWLISNKFFNMSGSQQWYFNSGVNFNQSNSEFINSIDKWVLGNGNYPSHIEDPNFEIEDPVASGTIDSVFVDSEKIVFEFIVPETQELTNLSELGLYISQSPETLVLGATFPKIDKTNVELHVVITVWKKDLIS